VLGAEIRGESVRFSVWSAHASQIWVCVFDGDDEIARVPLERGPGDVHSALVQGIGAGARYGLRADGPWDPHHGHRFDPMKLLVDPYAVALDNRFVWDPHLAQPRGSGGDTAALVPKAIVTALPPPVPRAAPRFTPGGLIYEIPVRPFSMLHPDVPEPQRGTVAALGHPAVLDHLTKLRVGAVELMPIAAWIDERHLAPLGLTNSWGYNPVAMMAPDPRLCPGGIAELRTAVAALHEAGIGVLLDVVFNHTGESDTEGPTLSLRGLDNRTYYRHDTRGHLVNDTGCGNTLACDHPATRRLILDTLRHFVTQAGIDGFRFDLAPVLGRTGRGFDPDAAIFAEIASDPVLSDRVMIAEPWDIGPGGYQLGRFPDTWLEWNDSFRDRVRRFWRGDRATLGEFATALSGSGDIFPGPQTRSVNMVAAHDGFTLHDLVAYREKHNHANGENNRDGHGENWSWNNGTEGPSEDPLVLAARARDVRALLATLFASRGTILLTAGDEFGRTQRGNNNAYAQDNVITWLDWQGRDRDLERYVCRLADLRAAHSVLSETRLLTGDDAGTGLPDVAWLGASGAPLEVSDWEGEDAGVLVMTLQEPDGGRIAVLVNRTAHAVQFQLPGRSGCAWTMIDGANPLPPRCVAFAVERAVLEAP
jgi:glycogen debranching enzyme